nr:hypothetical protein Iba_chr02fCG6480 [Ipomoea batatas]
MPLWPGSSIISTTGAYCNTSKFNSSAVLFGSKSQPRESSSRSLSFLTHDRRSPSITAASSSSEKITLQRICRKLSSDNQDSSNNAMAPFSAISAFLSSF